MIFTRQSKKLSRILIIPCDITAQVSYQGRVFVEDKNIEKSITTDVVSSNLDQGEVYNII
jgi:hypothetical protein